MNWLRSVSLILSVTLFPISLFANGNSTEARRARCLLQRRDADGKFAGPTAGAINEAMLDLMRRMRDCASQSHLSRSESVAELKYLYDNGDEAEKALITKVNEQLQKEESAGLQRPLGSVTPSAVN